MGHKRIIVTVLAAAALFGAAISGCNREREPRLASASQRRGASLGGQPRAELAEGLAVRPAEVLSASAHRMSPLRRTARRQGGRAQEQQYASRQSSREDGARERGYSRSAGGGFAPLPVVVRSGDLARYEPLPEPVPVHELYSARAQTYQTQSGPHYASAGAPPVYNQTTVPMQPYPVQSPSISEPYTLAPSQTRPGEFDKVYTGGGDGRAARPVQVHPSPELTMARAQLQGSAPLSDRVALPVRAMDVPPPTPDSFPVPIPELEPMRYSRGVPAVGAMQPMAAAPVRAVRQQPQTWQPQVSQAQPQQQAWQQQQPQSLPQKPLPPLPSAYVWGSQPAAAAPAVFAPAQVTPPPAEPYGTVPALPAVTPAIQGWVASPTTAMRVFR